MQIQRIKNVAKFYNGYAFKSKNYTDAGDYIVRIGDIKQKGIDLSNAKRVDVIREKKDLSNFQIKQNSILIAMSGATTGKVSLYNLNQLAYLNQRVGMLVCENNILPKYLYYFLSNYSEKFLTSAIGAAVQNLSKSQIENTKIPVPSLQEQEKIVEKLDKVLKKINLIIENKKYRYDLLNQFYNSKLNQVFENEINETTENKLGNLVDFKNGYAFKSKYFSDTKGMPLIRIRDIKNSETNTYFLGEYDKNFIVKNGDFLIGMDGSFEIAQWKGKDSLLNQRVCTYKSRDTYLNEKYLYYFLKTKLKQIEDVTGYTTVKHLSINTLKNLLIQIPSIQKQKNIVKNLDETFNKIDNKLKIIEREEVLLNNFKKSILNKHFSYE